jgi:hypothetical protein
MPHAGCCYRKTGLRCGPTSYHFAVRVLKMMLECVRLLLHPRGDQLSSQIESNPTTILIFLRYDRLRQPKRMQLACTGDSTHTSQRAQEGGREVHADRDLHLVALAGRV